MSWLFATGYDAFMRRTEQACLSSWRHELLAGLRGSVLEIGAGTGANLAHYPASLDRLVVTEADDHMLRRLERSSDAKRAQIVRASADALPFADESFDTVVSTLVLCTVPDPTKALSEIFRVLIPGGKLVFLEHVGAETPSRARWQRRLEPLWSRLAEGCHVTRDTRASIARAGFTIESLVKEDMRKALPIVKPTIRGVARRPAGSGHVHPDDTHACGGTDGGG